MINFGARLVKPGYLGLSRTDLRECGVAGMAAAGRKWHRDYKRHHFEKYAFAKYRYKRRTTEYERRKAREHPENAGRPLMFTGESRRSAMASDTVIATAKNWETFRAEVHVDAPALNYRQLHDEMTRVAVSEEREMAREFRQTFERRLVSRAHQKVVPIEMTVRTG
jgi:hypothetical protein